MFRIEYRTKNPPPSPGPLTSGERSAVGKYCWLFLALLFLASGLISFSGSNSRLLGPPFGEVIGQDFRQVLRAAEEIQQGVTPYAHAMEFGKKPDFAQFIRWNASTFPYPPIVGIAATPLLKFETEAAVRLWTWINWLLIFQGVFLMGIAGSPPGDKNSWKYIFLAAAFSVIYAPLHMALKLVQLDILIFGLLLAACFFYIRGSPVSGLPLACAIAIKPILVPLLFFFIWKREWAIVIVCVLTDIAAMVAGFVIGGWGLLPDYMEVNRLWGTGGILSYPFNQSVNGLTIRLFTENLYIDPLLVSPALASVLRYGAALLAVILWILSVSRNKSGDRKTTFVEFGLTITTLQFISPLVDDNHYIWTLIPILALLTALLHSGMQGWRQWTLFSLSLLTALYLAQPDLHDAIYFGWESLANEGHLLDAKIGILTGAYVYGLIGLHLCLLGYLHMYTGDTRSISGVIRRFFYRDARQGI